MPLPIMLALVVGGIAGVALLTHLFGMSRTRSLHTPSDALAAWEREFPETHAWAATLAADGQAAMLDTADGPGLVWVMGADTTARLLTGAQVTPSPEGLRVHFDDFAAPLVTVQLDETADIDTWRALLSNSPEPLPA